MLPKKLQKKIDQRVATNSLRELGENHRLVDFASNDYLGFSTSKMVFKRANEILKNHNLQLNGASGSRLLSGNHALYDVVEQQIAQFHKVESALVFNSGYDANVGFFSSVPQRGDIILYDELCHASIRDGIQLSHAKAYKFKHNDISELKAKCKVERSRSHYQNSEIYVVTESVFSMDGDQPDLKAIATFCSQNNFHLIVDEAHALGVVGEFGEGLVQQLNLENEVFARLVTFGKALGCHGAAILGSEQLKQFLVNFARSFIYTTGMPPHSLATITAAYRHLKNDTAHIVTLKNNIALLLKYIAAEELTDHFVASQSAIHSCIIPGNNRVKKISKTLIKEGFNVKPILSPTVPLGQERLRICMHSFNSKEDIKTLIHLIKENL